MWVILNVSYFIIFLDLIFSFLFKMGGGELLLSDILQAL